MLGDKSGEGMNVSHADVPSQFPAIQEGDQRRDTADSEVRRGSGVGLRVQLEDKNLAGPGGREMLQGRSHRTARAAPVGVEIHQNGDTRTFDDLRKIAIGHTLGSIQVECGLALGAFRMLAQPSEVDPIH